MHRPQIKEDIEKDKQNQNNKVSLLTHNVISFLKHRHTVTIMLLILFGSVFIYGVVRPAILGYSIYSQASDSDYEVQTYMGSIDSLSTELRIAQSNLTSCNSFNEKLFNQFDKHYAELIECKNELSFTREENSDDRLEYQTGLDEINDELSEAKSKLETIEDKYKNTITNAAINICCKKRVDEPNINSYSIEDNKIKCEANGEFNISC